MPLLAKSAAEATCSPSVTVVPSRDHEGKACNKSLLS